MITKNITIPLLVGLLVLVSSLEARRVRVRPTSDEEEPNIQYYSAVEAESSDEESEPNQRVVLVSADDYEKYYSQQPAAAPTRAPAPSRDNYYQPSRTSAYKAGIAQRQRESAPKQPPVQTIRNYNKVNDDGSFTFGYEAADGSFKEETRGTDCVVRGKYGYIDPDGNKREFTYVSGNPCDPNAPKDDQDEEEKENARDEDENVPQNYPVRPVRPLPSPKPAVSLFQTNFNSEEDEQPEPEQVLRPTITNYRTSPSYQTVSPYVSREPTRIYKPIQPTTPSSVIYKQSITPVSVTPRPIPTTQQKIEAPATTYRPQLYQVTAAPSPAPILYTKQISVTPRPHFLPSSTASPVVLQPRPTFDLEAELRKYQQSNSFISSNNLAKSVSHQSPTAPSPSKPTGIRENPVYSTELVYDPSSGQYKTQLYQTLPQTEGNFKVSQNLQPYVAQQRPQYVIPQPTLYRPRPELPGQTIYKQQQAGLQFQNSAELYAQQQRARAQQDAQATSPRQYYYLQPQVQPQQRYTNGQIDSFLRGRQY